MKEWNLVHSFLDGYCWVNGDKRIDFDRISAYLPELKEDLWKRMAKEWSDGCKRQKDDPYVRQVCDSELNEIYSKLLQFITEEEKNHTREIGHFDKFILPKIRKEFPPLNHEDLI